MKHVNNLCKAFVLLLSALMFLTAAWLAEAAERADLVDVPVLKVAVAGGDVIQEQDLTTKAVAPNVAERVYQLKGDVVGMEAKRNLRPGYPFTERQIQEPLDVRRGEAVLLAYMKPGMSLTLEGKSLTDGRKGDVVYVVNTKSNKRLTGVVSHTGVVQVR